jgi:large subunit ribosomal protein L9
VPIRLHREVSAHLQVNIKSDAPDRPAGDAAVADDSVFKSTYTGELDDNRD